MWVPKNAEEIERAARAGELSETPTFDAKADLPQPRKNADLAVDVAAMATDGGLLLYGVGEDENGLPSMPNPIPLAGAADRIGQIVSTSIAEVPYIDVRERPTEADPAKGYIVVIVPQSERAPHQVTVGGDLRFYGRGAKGNRRLTEGEVARLYQRRQDWQVSAETLLTDSIMESGVAHDSTTGYLHAFARPVVSDQSLFERATAGLAHNEVHQRLLRAVTSTKLRDTFSPSLESAGYWQRRGADEWRFSNLSDDDREITRSRRGSLVEVRLYMDGRGQLLCDRATDTRADQPQIMEGVIAGNVEAFFAIMGGFHEAGGYVGAVDVGVAVTNIRGAASFVRSQRLGFADEFTYASSTFTRTARVAAAELGAPDEVAHRLLRNFYEATTGQDGVNPFIDPNNWLVR